jgi:cytochrome o ubiquinol oxidase subunit IV
MARRGKRSAGRRQGENLAIAGALTLGIAALGRLFGAVVGPRRRPENPLERTSHRRPAMASSTTSEFDPHHKDIAPGDDQVDHDGAHGGVRGYLIGLGLAGFLTAASFFVAGTNLVYGPGIPVALIVLAIAQMGVHLVFFLHITTGPDNTNNTLALAFGVLIVVLVVGGSIWIMSNLNLNMMPFDPNTQMSTMPMG